jgi:hypothetical protein
MNYHINSNHDNRQSGPYLIPTFYLLLEVIIILLSLYIVNGGADFYLWNRYIVSATLIYFMFSSFRRYLRVIRRSKIRYSGDSHNKRK